MELNHISLYREHEDNPTADQVACYIFPAPRERSLHAQKKKILNMTSGQIDSCNDLLMPILSNL